MISKYQDRLTKCGPARSGLILVLVLHSSRKPVSGPADRKGFAGASPDSFLSNLNDLRATSRGFIEIYRTFTLLGQTERNPGRALCPPVLRERQ